MLQLSLESGSGITLQAKLVLQGRLHVLFQEAEIHQGQLGPLRQFDGIKSDEIDNSDKISLQGWYEVRVYFGGKFGNYMVEVCHE